MSKKVSRRRYVAYAGAGIVVVAAAGGYYYSTRKPSPTPTPTPPTTPTVPKPTTPTTPKPTTPKEVPKLTAWYLTDPKRNDYYQAMAQGFSKEDPEADCEFEFPGRYEEYLVKVGTAFATGTEPDVVYMWFGEEWTNFYARQGVIVPLDVEKYNIAEKLVPGILDLSTLDGKVYMVPVNLGAAFTYYNEPMVEEVGYTWEDMQKMPVDEFTNMCEKLKAKGYTPIIHNHETMNNTIIMMSITFGNALGRDKYLRLFQSWNKGATDIEKWNQSWSVKTFEYISDWIQKGYFAKGINAMDSPTMDRNFMAQQAAMNWSYISRVVMYKGQEDLKFNTAAGPIINTDESSQIQVHDTGFAITKKCKHPEAAMRFIDFMTNDEAGLGASQVGILSPIKTAFKPENYQALMPHYQNPLNKYSEGSKATIPRGDYYMSPEVNSDMHGAMAKFFDLDFTASDICNELDDIFEKHREG